MLDSFAKKFGLKPNNTIQIKEVEKNSIKVEIKEYKINLEKNNLTFSSFWKTYSTQFPLLASQVRKYCIVPSSSLLQLQLNLLLVMLTSYREKKEAVYHRKT